RKTRIYITKKFSAQQGLIVSKIILYTGLSLIFISILRELGFQLSTLVGAAGIVGIAVGFASQTSVSNIISGLFLIAERPFEVNDIITVGNITGAVLSIDILSIKLRTFDNKFVRIPNETIIKSDVTNVTRFPIRRIDIPVGVAYKEDIAKVRALLLDIARNEKVCLNEPEPIVILSGFGNSSVDMLLLVWAEKADWLQAKNSITESIKMRFDEEGIEIPFPHVSIYAGSETPPFPVKIISDNQ
ncbi:MAG: mechanosensitive ion channel family protein, partial [Nitrospinae bacterium]|nr:mechanosensitive ion channel family protein [Nitrospinota bacterium]